MQQKLQILANFKGNNMLKTISVIMILAISLFGSPNWYLESDSKIVGYGSNEKRDVAIALAYQMISNQVDVKVQSNINVYETSNVSNSSSDLNILSNNEFNIIKIELIELIDSVYYVKAYYDNTPKIIKFVKALSLKTLKPLNKPGPLNKTNFGIQLKSLLGYDIKLFLVKKGDQFLIYPRKFFTGCSVSVHDLMIESSKKLTYNKVYHSGDIVHFKRIQGKKYLTIISLEDNGRVGVLVKNVRNWRQKKIVNIYSFKKISYENYFYITSDSKISADFEELSKKILDDTNVNVLKLFEILEQNTFSSTILKIKG